MRKPADYLWFLVGLGIIITALISLFFVLGIMFGFFWRVFTLGFQLWS